MDLYFIGTHRYDALGRVKLKQWLEHMKREHDQDPAFIAVESVEEVYQHIDEHRAVFKWLLVNNVSWGKNLQPDVLSDIVLGLGYECDCHQQIYPHSRTLWLNDHITRKDEIRDYADKSCEMFRVYVSSASAHTSSSDFSTWVWEWHIDVNISEGFPKQEDFHDREWAQKINEEIKKHQDGWAIIIVGADHTMNIEGSVHNRLKGVDGIRIAEIKILCPESLLSQYEGYRNAMEIRSSQG